MSRYVVFLCSFMNSLLISWVDVPLKYGNALSALSAPALTVRNSSRQKMVPNRNGSERGVIILPAYWLDTYCSTIKAESNPNPIRPCSFAIVLNLTAGYPDTTEDDY